MKIGIGSSLVFILLLVSAVSYAQASEGIGIITSMEGVADVLRHGSSESVLLKDNDIVYLKDRVRTKGYSKLEITFRDKSKVKMAQNTCITVDKYLLEGSDRRIDADIGLTRGEVEAIVSKTGKPDTFVITTPNAKGKVKGSDIFVFYQGSKTGVLVKEGLISLLNDLAPEKKIEVAKGDFAMVALDKAPEKARPYLDAEMMRHKKEVEPSLARKWISYKGATQMMAALTTVTGEVRIYRKGAADWHAARQNEAIFEGDKLQTGEKGWVEVRLGNGNTILLHDNTELAFITMKYDPATGEFENTFKSEKGKVKAVIEKLGKKSVFQIKTPMAVCGARGTVMYLDISAAATQAFYEGGGGIITSTISSKTQMIEAGQNSVADAVGAISAPAFTPSEQKVSLDQSFSGRGMAQGYTGSQSVMSADSGTVVSHIDAHHVPPSPDKAVSAVIAGERMASLLPPFDEVAKQLPPPPIVDIYSRTLNFNNGTSHANFDPPGSFDLHLKSDGTWSATLTANRSGPITGSWDLNFEKTLPIDQVSLSGTVTIPLIGSGSWNTSVSGTITGTPIDKTLTGTASGTFNTASNDPDFVGDASGTWQNQ